MPTPGIAGGGVGGWGGCGVAWESRLGQRGGGSTGGFGGTHPPGSGGFADTTGGGGGNGTAGADGLGPVGGFSTEPGRGGCANVAPLVFPLRGGGGGGGGGCDIDTSTPTGMGTSNDGGAGGGSGGGAIRFEAAGDIVMGPTGNISANGGMGGTNSGNGSGGGGGAGGTILLIAGGSLTVDGTLSATGGAGGPCTQVGAGSNGGAGGAGIIGFYDSNGVIAGGGAANPAPLTGVSPAFGFAMLFIDNEELPSASPASPYMATLSARGGSGAYSWSIVGGGLPAGLNLNPATGVISGTSSATPSTRAEFTIRVDDGSTTSDRAFCILTEDTDFAIATTTLPDTDPATMYMQSVAVVGGSGAPAWSVEDGALPTGLTLDPATGVISGMTGMNPESATFTIKVIDGYDESVALTYTIEVGDPGGLSPLLPPLPEATECQPYSETLVPLIGTPPHTYEILGGALPNGMSLDPMTGAVTGSPDAGEAAMSPFNLCILVYDSVGAIGLASVDLDVLPNAVPPTCLVAVDPNPVQECNMPGLAIPDNDPLGATDTITVASSGIIQSMTVDVDLTHTWVGDLELELTHVPTMTSIILVKRPGLPGVGAFGCDQADILCTFDDTAMGAATDQCDPMGPAIGGAVRPDAPLGLFTGLDCNGDWTLTVKDNAGGDTGTLQGWCLNFGIIVNPVGGDVPITLTPTSLCGTPVSVDSFEYSTDGGMTFAGTCTPAMGSPLLPPQPGVASGTPAMFLWDSRADGIGSMMVQTDIVIRATVSDPAGSASCTTLAFNADNSCFCGDCDISGSLPVSILAALIAAQFAAGLGMPTTLQQRCGDTNSSGGIEIIDALLMAQDAAGIPATLMCP
jgi:subtilisin-like proprotein convertase family protein